MRSPGVLWWAVLAGGFRAAAPAEASAQADLEAWSESGIGSAMPLLDESLQVRIEHQYATSELRQVWQNETAERLEGRFHLRAGDGARVTGYAYWNGEEKIVGEIFERQAAWDVYTEVTGIGRDPGLLEEEGNGAFSFRVFPIEPGERKRTEVRWDSWLPRAGRQVEYDVPLTAGKSTVEVEIRDPRPIDEVTSPTHDVETERNERGDLVVRVGERRDDSGRFVLRWRYADEPWALSAQVHRDAGQDLLEDVALAGETDELVDEVVELGLAYGLVTPYTAFLAIPEKELTGAARELVESARDFRRRILAAHPEAAALSRSLMPPGDPLLRVRASPSARHVTAYFPFGLVKDLAWDPAAERWQARFLVPSDVPDGTYQVLVVIVGADGTVESTTVPYVIDSREPEFTVDAVAAPGGVRLRVAADEASRRVTAALVSDPRLRVGLADAGDGTTFEGVLPLPPGTHELRVVVADEARNEGERVVTVEVPP
jgi:Ca-activated chloride channel family protein